MRQEPLPFPLFALSRADKTQNEPLNLLTNVETCCKERLYDVETQDDYLTLSEAADYLRVSRVTVWRRICEGKLATYQASTSRREKLVRRQDLDELKRPRPVARRRNQRPEKSAGRGQRPGQPQGEVQP